MAFLPRLDIQELFTVFAQLYDGLLRFWQVLGTPVGVLIDGIPSTAIITDILKLLADTFPDVFSVSLLGLIAGTGVLFFVAITLVKWVLDILP